MGMNPDTNKIEDLSFMDEIKDQVAKEDMTAKLAQLEGKLLRPDGTPVPKHWSVFKVGENYVIENYTFKCQYIGETSILFEPVGPVVVGGNQG